MDYLSALALGTALAMDAAAASITCGMVGKQKPTWYAALLPAGVFGMFQMLMPVLGWSIGKVGSSVAADFDHIAAFLILLFLGTKMLLDARHPSGKPVGSLWLLALATSIDALAAGITLPTAVGAAAPMAMFQAVLCIGGVTFAWSLLGYWLGSRFRRINAAYTGMAGGAMLILIGIKTLLTG